jgi:nitrogen fixation/metabolism regulation signal transduction histidine kinase
MVVDTLKRLTSGPKPIALLFVLLLASIYLMSGATQNSAQFGRLYSLLLAVNILALVLLIALILRNLIQLVQQYRRRAAGSRLTVRLVVMFTLLAVAPVSVVYYFSLEFLNRGIESWFDVRVEHALEDALELGRRSLDDRLREMLRQTHLLAGELTDTPKSMYAIKLNELRDRAEATEMTLLDLQGHVLASSSTDPADIVPAVPNTSILRQLREGLDYAGLDPQRDQGLHVRIAVTVPGTGPTQDNLVLHALYPIAPRINELAESVQKAFTQYKELAFLREPLKYSFTLTLSLVLLLSLLTAVWAAFFSARRLVAPIRDLAEGTRAVAAGDYDKRLPLPGRDELGFLVRSFNEMTRKIARSRDEARQSQQQVEAQRAYLEAVLGRLSSGVLTLDTDHVLRTVNSAADQILGIALEHKLGTALEELPTTYPLLLPLVEAITPHLQSGGAEWREEVTLLGGGGRQVLMCRGSSLAGVGQFRGGHVIVFDDITALIQAQRDAAWGEVARRLAHEIKNPLTPIQLSAERLRRKYLDRMESADAEVLDRATHTIVQQVETMKEMVKAFSDYARTPQVQLLPVDINNVIGEVVELYRGDERTRFHTRLDPALPPIEADAGRLRQLLHNLIKNATESRGEAGRAELEIATRCASDVQCRFVELQVQDNGPGIPEELLGRLFEPYVTTKRKGTGLGLAIVKKIVEEHGGILWAENSPEGGACIVIRLPVRATAATEGPGEESNTAA